VLRAEENGLIVASDYEEEQELSSQQESEEDVYLNGVRGESVDGANNGNGNDV
jgi:hypothetical protein